MIIEQDFLALGLDWLATMLGGLVGQAVQIIIVLAVI